MNWLVIAVIILIVLATLAGAKRGLVKTVLSFASFFVSLVIMLFAREPVSDFVKDQTGIYAAIETSVMDAHGGTPDDYRITVGYGYDADEGKRLWMQTRAALRAKYPGAQCEVGLLQIGCTIAVHTGPYALGMGVMRRWKKQN